MIIVGIKKDKDDLPYHKAEKEKLEQVAENTYQNKIENEKLQKHIEKSPHHDVHKIEWDKIHENEDEDIIEEVNSNEEVNSDKKANSKEQIKEKEIEENKQNSVKELIQAFDSEVYQLENDPYDPNEIQGKYSQLESNKEMQMDQKIKQQQSQGQSKEFDSFFEDNPILDIQQFGQNQGIQQKKINDDFSFEEDSFFEDQQKDKRIEEIYQTKKNDEDLEIQQEQQFNQFENQIQESQLQRINLIVNEDQQSKDEQDENNKIQQRLDNIEKQQENKWVTPTPNDQFNQEIKQQAKEDAEEKKEEEGSNKKQQNNDQQQQNRAKSKFQIIKDKLRLNKQKELTEDEKKQEKLKDLVKMIAKRKALANQIQRNEISRSQAQLDYTKVESGQILLLENTHFVKHLLYLQRCIIETSESSYSIHFNTIDVGCEYVFWISYFNEMTFAWVVIMSLVCTVVTKIHFIITEKLLLHQKAIVNAIGWLWTFVSSLFFIAVILLSIVFSGSPEKANAWALNYSVSWLFDNIIVQTILTIIRFQLQLKIALGQQTGGIFNIIAKLLVDPKSKILIMGE